MKKIQKKATLMCSDAAHLLRTSDDYHIGWVVDGMMATTSLALLTSTAVYIGGVGYHTHDLRPVEVGNLVKVSPALLLPLSSSKIGPN